MMRSAVEPSSMHRKIGVSVRLWYFFSSKKETSFSGWFWALPQRPQRAGPHPLLARAMRYPQGSQHYLIAFWSPRGVATEACAARGLAGSAPELSPPPGHAPLSSLRGLRAAGRRPVVAALPASGGGRPGVGQERPAGAIPVYLYLLQVQGGAGVEGRPVRSRSGGCWAPEIGKYRARGRGSSRSAP